MNTLLQDLRYGLRMLAKNPGFTTVAVLTLALGIGANTAIFSLVDGMFLRPLPVANPGELATIVVKTPEGAGRETSYADCLDLRQQASTLTGIAVWDRESRFLNSMDESSQILVDVVSPDYFAVLGVKAALGRTFLPEIDKGPQPEPAVVISYRVWKGRLGGDPEIAGETIKMTGKTVRVLGVAPPHFQGLARVVPTDAWLLAPNEVEDAQLKRRDFRGFEAMARLRHGVRADQARAELDMLGRRLAASYPATNRATTFGLETQSEQNRDTLQFSLFAMAVVGLVLLISCANVAGLLLARADARRREVALRVALGAGRGRLFRQFVTEGFLLSLAGAALGLLLTGWLMGLQSALMPPTPFQLGADLRIDIRLALFTVIVSLFATLVFTFAPALQAWKTELTEVLKGEEGSVRQGRYRLPVRNILVIGQIAVSVILLTASALLFRSLFHSMRLPVGFDTQKNLVVVNLFSTGQPSPENTKLLPLLAERVRGLPGVRRATCARRILLSGSGGGADMRVSIPGVELPRGQSTIPIKFNSVGPEYFHTVGTRILQGRDFASSEGPESQKVAIVNETMARRFWSGGDAIGRILRIEGVNYQIIGIAEDAKIIHLHEAPEPYMYFAFAQTPSDWGALIVETAGDPRSMVQTIKREIRAADNTVAIWEVQTSQDLMRYALWDELMPAKLVGGLSLLGVFLAAVGLYGVVAYSVNRRTREIGIRIALGAHKNQVVGLVLLQGLKLIGAGTLVGLAAALGATRLFASSLYGVKPYDPISFAAGAFLVATVALLASYVPARRATKVDPMVALRHE
jgi:putative ABC transport system permease protein